VKHLIEGRLICGGRPTKSSKKSFKKVVRKSRVTNNLKQIAHRSFEENRPTKSSNKAVNEKSIKKVVEKSRPTTSSTKVVQKSRQQKDRTDGRPDHPVA